MTARSVVRWTAEARACVLALYADPAHTGSTIAAVLAAEHGLHVTASAVIGIAYRGDAVFTRPPALTREETRIRSRDRKRAIREAARAGRPAPARKPRPAAPPRVRIPKPVKPAAAKAPKPAQPPRPAPVPRPSPAIVLPSLGIPLTSAPAGACRYIADDPKAGPALCCGHPTAAGSAWCEGHRRLCTVPDRRRASVYVPNRRAA